MIVTTPGAVISNMDVTGSIEVAANNVTIQKTKVTVTGGGCGTLDTCGNWDIKIDQGVTGTQIKDVELTVDASTTVEHQVRNLGGPTTTATRLYTHNGDTGWLGSGTIKDSYMLITYRIIGDHIEDIYNMGGDGALVVQHDTLLDPYNWVANVFGDTFGGVEDITVNNSLLAGGGWSLQLSKDTTVASRAVITGNRFARCLTTPVYNPNGGEWNCSGGRDSHGYFPHSGAYAPAQALPANTTWSANYWDGNLRTTTR
jgi:hypothetical protein